MANGVHEVRITLANDRWEVYLNGVFFCCADTYMEAINEIQEVYGH